MPFGQMESVRLCLFDGIIDGSARVSLDGSKASAPASAGTAATAAIAIPAAAEADKQV
ncbi:MAG TPA: hypothetical protein VGW77_28095 [Candidatus Binatia bacterium]|nr:hypothetical protein [Candidatus Binatia bacterium]